VLSDARGTELAEARLDSRGSLISIDDLGARMLGFQSSGEALSVLEGELFADPLSRRDVVDSLSAPRRVTADCRGTGGGTGRCDREGEAAPAGPYSPFVAKSCAGWQRLQAPDPGLQAKTWAAEGLTWSLGPGVWSPGNPRWFRLRRVREPATLAKPAEADWGRED
jgi:hypothetical protein